MASKSRQNDTGRQLHDAVQQFANHTSLHGAPRIFRSRSVRKRIFWFVVFVGASAMFGFLLSKQLLKYFAYEKRFNIEVRKEAAVIPLITVCNMRPFEASVINKIYEVFSTPRNWTQRRAAEAAASENNIFIDWLLKLNSAAEMLEEHGYDLSNLWNAQMLVDAERRVLERGLVKRQNFMIDCYDTAHMTSCDDELFSWRLLYDGVFVSQCTTYNMTQGLSGTPRRRPSPRHKLEWFASVMDGHGLLPPVEFSRSRNVTSSSKINGLFSRSLGREGVEVYIHQQGYRANIVDLDRHVFVPPGHMAHFLVTMRSTEISDTLPIVTCQREYPIDPHPPGVYVQTACYYACLQNEIVSSCQCKNPELSNDDDYSNVTMCFSLREIMDCVESSSKSSSSATQATCDNITALFDNVLNRTQCATDILNSEHVHTKCDALCPRACEEVTYDVEARLVKWPLRNTFVYNVAEKVFGDLVHSPHEEDAERLRLYERYFGVIYDDLDPGDFSHMTFNYSTFASELTVLDVELKTNDLVVTQEMREYTIYQLLSDIGGQLGLCIGMSVITVTEVLELCLNFCKILCGRRWKRKSNTRANVYADDVIVSR